MSENPIATDNEPKTPTQAELYDDLRRIGELEDEKQQIQAEIDEKTQKLQNAVSHLDAGSLLHKMLKSVLPREAKPAAAKPAARKAAVRKASSRKRS